VKSRCYANYRLEWLGEKVFYGCETSLHSDIRLAVCHRWLWLCAPAPSRNLRRDHARIQRPSPSVLVAPRLSAIFGACRLLFYSRTTRNIDRSREPATKGSVRMGENAVGSHADIRCCKCSDPPFSDECQGIAIRQRGASCSRTRHHYRHLYRLCFLDSLRHLERLSPTNNQARRPLLT